MSDGYSEANNGTYFGDKKPNPYDREPNSGSKRDIEARVLANCKLARRVWFDEEYLALSVNVLLSWRWVITRGGLTELDDIERVVDRSVAVGVWVRSVRFWLPVLWWRLQVARNRG